MSYSPVVFSEESHPGMNAEVLYSEAVVALSRRQTEEALKTLDRLLKEDPKNIQALELKALTLKNEGDLAHAIETYKKLLKAQPEADRGPYHYELAMIYYRQRNTAYARYHFLNSLSRKINPTISRFFLGRIAYGENRYPVAEGYFRRVSQDDVGEMKLISHYYLGLIELKSGYSLGATRDLRAARRLAATLPDNQTAKDIVTATEQVLAPFGKPQYFANIAMLGGYDSNISQIPTSLANSGSHSGMGTAKSNFSAAVGYMTAPLDTVQYVGSYRLNLNKDFSADTRSYEFVTNTLTLNINYLPLNPTQAGVKLEGNFMFQNYPSNGNTTDTSASYTYSKFNLSGELGPYVRYQPSREISTELDFFLRPQRYYMTPDENGLNEFIRLGGHLDLSKRLFNPGASLSYENVGANSGTYKCNTIGLEASNLLKLTPDDNLTLYLDFLNTKYPDFPSTVRSDKNYVVRFTHAHLLNARWSVLADVSYTKNSSSISDTYTYNRFQSGFGLSWTP